MYCKTNTLIIICSLISNLRIWSRGEQFMAISNMESLLDMHKNIIDSLDNYILKEEQRLSTLKR